MEEMHRQGLTVEAIVSEIKRGVTEGMHPHYSDQPDNFNRRAYTDMAIRLYGGYVPSKLDVDIDRRELKIEISPETLAAMKKGIKVIKSKTIIPDEFRERNEQ